MHVCMYMCVYVYLCMYMCVCIYIYIYTSSIRALDFNFPFATWPRVRSPPAQAILWTEAN